MVSSLVSPPPHTHLTSPHLTSPHLTSPHLTLKSLLLFRLFITCYPGRLSFVASLEGHEGDVTAIATSPTMGDVVTACPNCKQFSVDIYVDGITNYLY